MKFISLVFVTMLAVCTLSLAASAQTRGYNHNINSRERHQQRRIAEGIENGSLTPAEAARLERNEAEVRRIEARLRENGLSRGERARLERRLNELSRAIYRQKHDRQHGYRG